jgi:Uma2 family endonuclease
MPDVPRFTIKHYRMLPEGFPAQLINGALVAEATPTYGHQYWTHELVTLLDALVGRARVAFAPLDVVIDQYNVYQPDVIVFRELPRLTDREVPPPLLAFEVLSPSTARRDRNVKRKRMLAAGTAEVWLVDPATQTIELHDETGCRTAQGGQELRSRALPGLRLVPASFFLPPAPQGGATSGA